MGTETITRLMDDFDGSDADRAVNSADRGQEHRICPCKGNAEEFPDAIAPYPAEANGVEMSPCGRIRSSVTEPYRRGR